ncbi:MAG: asparagine synthase-related protein [Pseudomonadota bacterium]
MIASTPTRDLTQIDFTALPDSPKHPGAAPRLVFLSSGFHLSNRGELTAALALPSGATTEDILIAGWERWGEALPDTLRGAFAFALYLPQTRAIFAARDIFGLSPLYYAWQEDSLILGSASRAVRSLLPGQGSFNELMLTDFVNEQFLETDQTFFNEIARLPQAHCLRATRGDIATERYWRIEDVAQNHSPDDAPQRFRALFDAAVADCVTKGAHDQRGGKDPVLLISGGMDSSAIAASMRAQDPKRDIHAAAMTFHETPVWEDKPYLADIASHAALNLDEVPSDNHNPLTDMERWLAVMDGPYLPRGWSISGRLLPMLRAKGFTRILSGHGGDEIVSFGFGRLNEMAIAGRWLELFKTTRASSGLLSGGAWARWRTFQRYLVHIPAYRALRNLRAKLKANPSKAARSVNSSAQHAQEWLAPSLAAKMDLSRYDQPSVATQRHHTERMMHEEAMTLGVQPLSLEVFAVCAEASDVEVRFPFYDRDLLELCLSLTSDWKLRDGLSRYVLRAAMGEDLPRSIRERVNKHDFLASFLGGLWQARDEVEHWTDPDRPGLTDFINRETLVALRARLSQNEMSYEWAEANFLWRVAVLGMWLEIAKQPLERPTLEPVIKE